MERKDLEALGITGDALEKVIGLHGQTTQNLRAQLTAAEGERDSLKTQVTEFTGKLEGFKGVNPEELNKQIEQLKGDLTARETEFKGQLAKRDLEDLLKSEIGKAGGINPRAIMALLDVESIEKSTERTAEIAKQLTKLKESDANQFKIEQGAPTPAAGTGTGTPPATEKTTFQKLNEHRIVGK